MVDDTLINSREEPFTIVDIFINDFREERPSGLFNFFVVVIKLILILVDVMVNLKFCFSPLLFCLTTTPIIQGAFCYFIFLLLGAMLDLNLFSVGDVMNNDNSFTVFLTVLLSIIRLLIVQAPFYCTGKADTSSHNIHDTGYGNIKSFWYD